MPQLDTIYIMTTYLWTWLMLYLTAQKIKTFLMATDPQKHPAPNKPTPVPSWL